MKRKYFLRGLGLGLGKRRLDLEQLALDELEHLCAGVLLSLLGGVSSDYNDGELILVFCPLSLDGFGRSRFKEILGNTVGYYF